LNFLPAVRHVNADHNKPCLSGRNEILSCCSLGRIHFSGTRAGRLCFRHRDAGLFCIHGCRALFVSAIRHHSSRPVMAADRHRAGPAVCNSSQHSAAPDDSTKLRKWMPGEFHGAFFCICTCVSLLLIFAFWRGSSTVIWHLTGALAAVMIGGFYLSWVALLYSISLTGLIFQTVPQPPRRLRDQWFFSLMISRKNHAKFLYVCIKENRGRDGCCQPPPAQIRT